MKLANQKIAEKINNVIIRVDSAIINNGFGQVSVSSYTHEKGLLALLKQTIKTYAPHDSTFYSTIAELENDQFQEMYQIEALKGTLCELQYAYSQDLLQSVKELVHAELYSDMLSGAKYLLEESWKDAAAVMIGAVFEENLRKLCNKHGIDPNQPDGRPKKANMLNQELAVAKVYDQFTSKTVTAWLDLRNNAAHGHFAKYDQEKVLGFHHFVEQFLSQHLA